MRFKVTETTFAKYPKDDKELEVCLHVFEDGDIGLLVNGEMILYLKTNGRILMSNLYPDKYKEMGFQVDDDHVKVTW